jgi:hypothetical protein
MLPTPCTVFLADKKKAVPYISIGMVVTWTWVSGTEKNIVLQNMPYFLEIRGWFISILKMGEKDISITFEDSKVTLGKDGVKYAEGQLTRQHYWLTLSCASPSVRSAQTIISIDTLHTHLGHFS